MNDSQKRVVAVALYAIAIVLFVFFFGRGFWDWATWNPDRDSIDLGFLRVNVRPPFPGDVRSILVGIVLPIALAAGGRVLETSRRP